MVKWTNGYSGNRLITARSGDLLEVHLSHGRVNALDSVTYEEIQNVFTEVGSTPDVGVVLLLGDGDCFSAGQDVSDANAIAEDGEAYLTAAAEALVTVTVCPAIVVAAVRRFAIGAGLILAASADVLVLDESARLALPELQYGVVAGAAHVSRWIGGPAAEGALLTGKPIAPISFAQAGAVIVPDAQVEQTARTLADGHISCDAATARMSKAVLARDRLKLAERYRSEIRATMAAGMMDFNPPSK